MINDFTVLIYIDIDIDMDIDIHSTVLGNVASFFGRTREQS